MLAYSQVVPAVLASPWDDDDHGGINDPEVRAR